MQQVSLFMSAVCGSAITNEPVKSERDLYVITKGRIGQCCAKVLSQLSFLYVLARSQT